MATTDDTTDDTAERIGTEPIDGDGTYPFAGLTRYDDDVDAMMLPETVWTQQSSMKYWAQAQAAHSFDYEGERDLDPSVLPERGLHTLIPDLPRAQEAEVQWVHPRTGDVIKTAKHNAVINPTAAEEIIHVRRADGTVEPFGTLAEYIARKREVDVREVEAMVEEFGPDEAADEMLTAGERDRIEDATFGDDALYHIPTRDYTIINPSQFLDPLCEVLRERELGEKVFGELRLERNGGRATLDIYMDGQHVESPAFDADREPIVVGLQVQWDFYGDWAVRACGQGLDWACTNRIHRLTNREVVKHAGDVESRQDWAEWWAAILDALEEKRDHLSRIIEAAMTETLSFRDMPDDLPTEYEDTDSPPWTALYAYMDLPDYLAEQAGRRLRTRAENAYEPTWWDIHSAATYAVTHHARGQAGLDGAWDQYAATANDMLMNPAQMEERIVTNYEADHEDDDEALASEGGGVARIRNAFESVADKKEQYEQWEAELREMGVEV